MPSPSGSDNNERFTLTLLLNTKSHPITVDVARWEVTVNGQTTPQLSYQLYVLNSGEIYTNPAHPHETSVVTLRAHSKAEVLITIPTRATTVAQIHLQFDGITVESRPVLVPPLLLKEERGEFELR